MKPKIVLDTSALVAFWRGEPGADKVHGLLRAGGCVMHEINASELCFTLPRRLPERFTRESTRAMLNDQGIITADDFDQAWADVVADIRLAIPALSVGDGVALALAATLGIPVLTSEKVFSKASAFAEIEQIR